MTRLRLNRWLPLCLILLALLLAGGLAVTAPASAERGRAAAELDLDDEEDFEDENEEFEDEEEWEEEWEDYLDEIELYGGLLELVARMGDIASSAEMSAVAAVMNVEDFVEDEQEIVTFLEGLLSDLEPDNATHLTAARAIRIKLAEVYGEMDRPDDARAQLRLLILGRPLGP